MDVEVREALTRVRRTPTTEVSELFAQHYTELKRIAHSRLYNANLRSPMATQSLLHESYLKLASINGDGFRDRGHFLAYSSRVMRNIIVDTVREVCADRRGGGAADLTLNTEIAECCPASTDVNALDEALEALQRIDPDLATLVEMRFFGGLTEPEVAGALGISERTVRREWSKARAALLVILQPA